MFEETIFDRELRPIVFKEVMSMPTTILDGESYEQAKARRFQEEAAIDARHTETTCCTFCGTVAPANRMPAGQLCHNCQRGVMK